jgi:hypothetical protein
MRSVCGVQSFYIPRSNQDGVAITAACITSPTLKSVTTKKIDGQNWEAAVAGSNIKAESQV